MDKIRPININDSFFINENFSFSNKTYWYHFRIIDITNKFFENTNLDHMLYDLKHSNAFFVFDHSMDSVVQKTLDSVLKALGILKIFKDNLIPLDRLIVLTPTDNKYFLQTSAFYEYVYESRKSFDEKKYHQIYFNALWMQIKNVVLSVPDALFDKVSVLDYDPKPKKHFMTFARRDSINRRFINYMIHTNNLFDKGYVSHQRVVENDIVKSVSEHKTEIRMLATRKDFDVKAYLDFGYKKHFLDPFRSKGAAATNLSLYSLYSSTSCFDLVSETDVQNNLFTTEKTLKPIIHRKPFFVSGSARTLSLLKNLGFQTFESIFDESYDKELVFYDRICMIFENIKYLCSLSLDECHKKMQSVQEILVHNQRHFIESDWTFNVDKKIQKRINEVLNV